MRESVFQDKVLTKLRSIPLSWWVKINDKTTIGLPDIIGAAGGVPFVLELKVNASLTKLQKYTLEQASIAGFRAFVVKPINFNTVFDIISREASAGATRETLPVLYPQRALLRKLVDSIS